MMASSVKQESHGFSHVRFKNSIECSFCKKQITFTLDETRTSGDAKLLNCPHCSRSVWIEFKGEKYYKENVK